MLKTKIHQLVTLCRTYARELASVAFGLAIGLLIMHGDRIARYSASVVPALRPTWRTHRAPREEPAEVFPKLQRTTMVVDKAPRWGQFRSPGEWNRPYEEMTIADFGPIPAYNLKKLTIPMKELTAHPDDRSRDIITAKLFYSTRYGSPYDIDAGEGNGMHRAIDIKLALKTPVQAIAGGRVHAILRSQELGLYVALEHRTNDDHTFYSLYGHLDSTTVNAGDVVEPGTIVGRVGTTGNTSGAHVHLQVLAIPGNPDRFPLETMPSDAEVLAWSIHPIRFIQRYAGGETLLLGSR